MIPNEAYFTIAQTKMVVPYTSFTPGGCKTKTVEAFAAAHGRRCYTLIGSLREPTDIAGYPYPAKMDKPIKDPVTGRTVSSYMSLMPPQYVIEAWEVDGKTVLFFDELTCCAHAVQAAMLGVLSERRVGDTPLPEELWMMAAGNPPETAAGGYDLEPPMANRMCHLPWEIDWNQWRQGQASGQKYPTPSFPTLPSNWKKDLGLYGSRIAAFNSVRPELFNAYPSDDRTQASGPWPSPRSWTNAGTCWTAMEAVGGGEEARSKVIAGCVGNGAAREFTTWLSTLDLPDPHECLKKARRALDSGKPYKTKWPEQADRMIAFLGAVFHTATQPCENREEAVSIWQAGEHIFESAWDVSPELATATAPTLLSGAPEGHMINRELSEKVLSGLERCRNE